jgi:hypothetical protein
MSSLALHLASIINMASAGHHNTEHSWAHKLIPHLHSQKKPYSAVTVAIENLTSESYEEDDVGGIPDLVEAIKLQASGPAEAARAIRKKLKYGNVHRQIRALVILDGLIQNAGDRFQRTFADEMLLERLRVCGTSDLSDPLVKTKCKELFRNWAMEYKNVRGLEQVASLYKVGGNNLILQTKLREYTGTSSPQAGCHATAVPGRSRDRGESLRGW